MKTKPNVIFILADDLGYGDISCFGNTIIRTPAIDSIASGGLSLTQHYSASPLCAPARAALLTGRYNHRTGAVDVPSNRGLDRISLDEKTMADVFKANGYATGMVGKWHNGLHDMRYHPNARGFTEFAGFLNGGMDYYQWVLDRNGRAEKCDGRYLTDVFTDEAVNFIHRHKSDPFFFYLCYNAPHPPYLAPEKSLNRFKGMHSLTDEVRTIYAMIEVMDAGIGRIQETLKKLGLKENTIVVFTSDNGPLLKGSNARYNGPFRGGKGDVLEGGIRVPAMLEWPEKIPEGENRRELFHFCDWLPSLTAMTGAENRFPKPPDGRDLSSYLQDGTSYVRQPRFWQRNRYEPVTRCNGAVRDGRWKLVWPMRSGADWKAPEDGKMYFDGLTSSHRLMDIQTGLPELNVAEQNDNPELYRIDLDPRESRDLSAEHPDRTESMKRVWDEWFCSVKEEWRSAYRSNTQKK